MEPSFRQSKESKSITKKISLKSAYRNSLLMCFLNMQNLCKIVYKNCLLCAFQSYRFGSLPNHVLTIVGIDPETFESQLRESVKSRAGLKLPMSKKNSRKEVSLGRQLYK